MLLAALMLSPRANSATAVETVYAGRYDAFWLWAGVKPQPVLEHARRLYLLQSEVEAGDPVRLMAQRPAIPRVHGPELWMVVRVGTLRWPPHVYRQVLAELERWRSAGNRVAGLQIDFDARTRHLQDYALFLDDLKHRLAGCRLGVTGLLDWSSNGDPEGLAALAGVVDEVVLQIYQGRRVIPGYAVYLARLDRLKIPFRIGLLQGGEWRMPPQLSSNPWFRGFVVFLRNPPRG
jgi:Protein of unknown function (DUF3142)